MSLDLVKNRQEITDAWKDVVDSKTDTDWALFGYEGHSNILKVVSSGDGGLTELTDELNSGKILYAFVKITNENTDLTKYLLVNWQGEGAPTLRKGTCANHIRDISKILAGAHLTINARTEDDIDPGRILDKLNSIRFAVKENRAHNVEEPPKAAVGTNYSPVIPSKEINSKDRDSFWKKEEEEERRRVENERGKQRNAKLDLEKEQFSSVDKAKALFTQNSAAAQLTSKTAKTAPVKPVRNSITRSVNNQLQQQPQQQPPQPQAPPPPQQQQQQEQEQEQEQEQKLSPEEYERAHQQQTLQMDTHDDTQPPNNDIQEHLTVDLEDEENNAFSTIKRSPYSKTSSTNSQNESSINNKEIINAQTESLEQSNGDKQPMVANDVTLDFDAPEDAETCDRILQEQGLRARALYDYQADDESEITFDPGDIITHIDQIDEGWWHGMAPDGSYGLFPANYVSILLD